MLTSHGYIYKASEAVQAITSYCKCFTRFIILGHQVTQSSQDDSFTTIFSV